MSQANLLTRDDTLFGVCQGLGEDLGVSPALLRTAFAVPLLLFPVATIAAYFAAGLLVAALRFLFPEPARAVETEAEAMVEAGAPAEAEAEPLPLAA